MRKNVVVVLLACWLVATVVISCARMGSESIGEVEGPRSAAEPVQPYPAVAPPTRSMVRDKGILPEPSGPGFDHAGHLERGIGCSDCHGGEDEEYKAQPPLEFCMMCHEEFDDEKPADRKASASYDESGQLLGVGPRYVPDVIFPHAKHIKGEDDCKRCHAGVIAGTATLQQTLPSMADCMACHEREAPQNNECATCHKETRIDVPPVDHAAPAWREQHGTPYGLPAYDAVPEDCAFCHEQSYCSSCHASAIPSSHSASGWGDAHGRPYGIAAFNAIPQQCTLCHQQSYCNDCHAAAMPSSHEAPGWRYQHGKPFGPEAMQALPGQCALCHQQSYCNDCHKSAKPRSHDGSWRVRHGQIARMGAFNELPADCRVCHDRSTCDTCHLAEVPRDHNNLWRLHGHAAAASIDRERCTTCHRDDSCVLCHQNALPRTHRGSWGSPLNRHCYSCHLPLGTAGEQGCAVCHRGAIPAHQQVPPKPPTLPHQTMDPNACRACHRPPPHADNGQSCLICHR
jgi:hypothetical protein